MKKLLEFWFKSPMKEHWFSSTPAIDQQILEDYNDLWESANRGDLSNWKETKEGCLALCILWDQLPLNMFRGTKKSFSTEQQAVAVCKHAIKKGFDTSIGAERIAFLYMPLMHSENLQDQKLSVALFEKTGLEGNIKFAKHHRDLIIEFGRFPHRNEVLGRKSTPEEVEYLQSKRAFTG